MKNSKEYIEALNMAFDVAKKPTSKDHPTAAHIIFDAGIDFAMSQPKHIFDGVAQVGEVKRFVVSEPEAIEPTKSEPLYEVGEIIEIFYNCKWIDAEFRDSKDGHICIWTGDAYFCFDQYGLYRKKQKPRIYISGRITGLDYKEAFDKFEQAEKELTAKGYEVVNPMKLVPFNKDWSWFDYLSADIKLMENCAHIYMLSNWRESGGASVEHEAAKWNNFTIIHQ